MWKARMAASSTGKCLGWLCISSVAASFGSPNVHSVDCASFQPLRSQHNPIQAGFLGPTTILNCNLFPLVHPPPSTQWKHPWYYLARPTSQFFLKLAIWRELLWAATSARELLNTVKWFTFYVCKFQSRAHNPWLVIYSALKSLKLIIS